MTTFFEALEAVREDSSGTMLYVSRPNGPVFRVDDLGQVLLLTPDCVYLGDLLDLDDWSADTTPGAGR